MTKTKQEPWQAPHRTSKGPGQWRCRLRRLPPKAEARGHGSEARGPAELARGDDGQGQRLHRLRLSDLSRRLRL